MSLKKTDYATGAIPTPVAVACEVVACRASYTLTADLSVGDIIQMMDLPAGHVPVDILLDADAMGAGTVSVGLANAGKTDLDTTASGGAAWLTGGAVTAAAGLRADAGGIKALSRVVADQAANRAVAVKIVTDTTATSGTIGLTLFYRAA